MTNVAILEAAALKMGATNDKTPSLVRLLERAVKRAHKNHSQPSGENISAKALREEFFHPVARSAKALEKSLRRLSGDDVPAAKAARSMAASNFFNDTLYRALPDLDQADPTADFLPSLQLALLVQIAEQADQRASRWLSKPGRKVGTGYGAFDMFVMALLAACETSGGKLTLYKSPHNDALWDGSLLKVVRMLKPLLPKEKFFPAGSLGNSLHTVQKRWRKETQKSGGKKG